MEDPSNESSIPVGRQSEDGTHNVDINMESSRTVTVRGKIEGTESTGLTSRATNAANPWFLIEKRSEILENLPNQAQKLWYDWELQVMVLLSLFFQILLILLGDRRKHNVGNKVGFIIWIAYLSADSVATFALGVLSKNHRQPQTHFDELKTFWVPFLLLHLGGPDTITAYALEDNELWLRHLLALVTQAGIAFYVIFKSWTGSSISILTILMFVTGIIKYGERTLALRSASKENFRNSMLSTPDPGPNYAKFMENYVSKQDEGFLVDVVWIVEGQTKLKGDQSHGLHPQSIVSETNTLHGEILVKAHGLFETFKRLFADLILSFRDGEQSKSFIQQSSPKKAFNVLEIELGFMFDVLYTKAPIVYTSRGGLIRSFCFCLTISVFVIFTKVQKPNHYSNIDIIITYLLLVVAILLEIYAFIILLFSDWVLLWMSKHKMPSMVNIVTERLQSKKRWSNSMGQYNLLGVCLAEHTKFTMVLMKLCPVQEMLEMYLHTSFKDVPYKLKELVFEQLKRKLEGATGNNDDMKSLCTSGAKEILSGANLHSLLGWSISDVEFHQSILLWHIATDLCYDLDLISHSTSPSTEFPSACAESIRDMCKLLSDYMLYLLIAHPFMLPEGIGQIRFRDTCAEAKRLFKGKKSDFTKENSREMLLRMNTDIPPIEVKGDRSKSVLFDACRLANSLQSLGTDVKWELMATVWVDTLSYAATQCRGANHAKQLGRGGELLTHIWLLMAHLGMTGQFQISLGQVRAKLIFG